QATETGVAGLAGVNQPASCSCGQDCLITRVVDEVAIQGSKGCRAGTNIQSTSLAADGHCRRTRIPEAGIGGRIARYARKVSIIRGDAGINGNVSSCLKRKITAPPTFVVR